MLNTAILASLIVTAFTTLVTFSVNAAQDPLELGGRVQSPTLQLRLVQSQLQSLTESGQEKSKLHELQRLEKILQTTIDAQNEVAELEKGAESTTSQPLAESRFELLQLRYVLEMTTTSRKAEINGLELELVESEGEENAKATVRTLQHTYLQMLNALQQRDEKLLKSIKKRIRELDPEALEEILKQINRTIAEVREASDAPTTDETIQKNLSTHSVLVGLQSLLLDQKALVERVKKSVDEDDGELREQFESIEDEITEIGKIVERSVDIADPTLARKKTDNNHDSTVVSAFSTLQATLYVLDDAIADTAESPTIIQRIKSWFWKAIPEEVGDGENVSVPLPKAFALLVALGLGSYVALKISDKIREYVLPRLGVKAGQALAVRAIIRYSLFLIFAVVAFRLLEIPLEAFAFVGGAIALAVGFGSQEIMNNFMSGVIMLFEQPIRVGDVLLYQDAACEVTQIGLRSTRLRHPMNHEITVPNTMLIERPVINMTLSETAVRTFVSLEVDRTESVDEGLSRISELVRTLQCILQEPEPLVILKEADTYYLVFEVHFCVEGSDPLIAMRAQSQVLAAISKIFPIKKEGDQETQETETAEQTVDEKSEGTGTGVSPSRSGKGMSKEQIRKEIARLQAMARTAG